MSLRIAFYLYSKTTQIIPLHMINKTLSTLNPRKRILPEPGKPITTLTLRLNLF